MIFFNPEYWMAASVTSHSSSKSDLVKRFSAVRIYSANLIHTLPFDLTICTNCLLRVPSAIPGVRYCQASRVEVTSFAALREIPLELAPTFPITKETFFGIERCGSGENAYRSYGKRKETTGRKEEMMRTKREIGRRKREEDRIRRREAKPRNRFWSIFQGEEKASSSSFENVM